MNSNMQCCYALQIDDGRMAQMRLHFNFRKMHRHLCLCRCVWKRERESERACVRVFGFWRDDQTKRLGVRHFDASVGHTNWKCNRKWFYCATKCAHVNTQKHPLRPHALFYHFLQCLSESMNTMNFTPNKWINNQSFYMMTTFMNRL